MLIAGGYGRLAFGLLLLFVGLLFVQLWRDVAGVTVRAEDLLALLLLGLLLLPALLRARLRVVRTPLNAPLLLWGSVVLLGTGVTLLGSFGPVVKRDALVNGIRLVLALSIFFATLLPAVPARRMTRRLFGIVVGFSVVTTAVSLLQMGYWDGWLPVRLPAWLVTFKEGANQARGREIFGLFVGDTGTHVWSAMLALQAIAVWVLASSSRRAPRRLLGVGYFGVLALLVVRTSVRNSILGLAVTVGVLILMQARRSRYPINRVARPALLVLLGVALLAAVFAFASDSYFVERIWQTIPRIEDGQLIIERGSNVYGRVAYAGTALQIFGASPVWGGGFYSYEAWTYRLGAPPIAHAHNSYLQTVAELGLIGAGALAWLLWRIGLLIRRAERQVTEADVWYGRLWRLTVGTTVFIAFTALFANPFWQPKEVAFCVLLLALLARYERAAGE